MFPTPCQPRTTIRLKLLGHSSLCSVGWLLAPLWCEPDCPGNFEQVTGVALIEALSLQTEDRELVGFAWLVKLQSEEQGNKAMIHATGHMAR